MLRMKGFTLIELMIVIGIVGILASIALPAYQSYLARTQISEAMTVSGGVRAEIASLYMSGTGTFSGIDSGVAGIPASASIQGSYVQSVSVSDGVVSVLLGNQASSFIIGETLTLSPMTSAGGTIVWGCSFSGNSRYLPQSCQ